MVMMNEDSKRKGMDRRAGFRLPDDYFDKLPERVMQQLPTQQPVPLFEPEEPTMWQRVRPWLYMAALFAGAAFFIRVAQPSAEEKAEALAREEVESQEVQYIGTVLEGAMMDDYSLYVYLEDGEHY